MKSRDLVKSTLEFTNTSGKVPRQLWVLPWATNNYPELLEEIHQEYPDDIIQSVYTVFSQIPKMVGDPHEIGISTDDWGCIRVNVQRGIIGEVKEPLVKDDEWEDYENVHIPDEWLTFDMDIANKSISETDKFVIAGTCPNPFERLQYIRGTENFYIDLMTRPEKMFVFIGKLHKHYCSLLEKWAQTDVDGLMMMDDWGSQRSLLINPSIWRELFKPMYKDYIDIAHKHGKKMFMHSDGYILDIIPDLIELGLDALNCQIFCMGTDKLAEFAGKITFWGEIDRQEILPRGSVTDVENAVHQVHDALWTNGGCIAQLEFGPGANPVNVKHAFMTWDKY